MVQLASVPFHCGLRSITGLVVVILLCQANASFETSVQDCPRTCRCMTPHHGDLDISECVIDPEHELSTILASYPNLTSLQIRSSHLSKFSDLSMLAQLTDLDVCNNDLRSVPCDSLSLPSLRHLNLSHNDIDSIHCNLSNLNKLETLDLAYNSMKSFPCELSKLSNLELLNLSNNAFENIPCDLSELTKLILISLDKNRLKSVPCKMRNLHRLEELWLSGNEIEGIECDLVEMMNVRLIVLCHNKMKSFPCELSRLRQLGELYLDNNDLEDIGCNLNELTALWLLDVSFNSFKSVPLELSELQGIIELDLSYNKISKFPHDLSYTLPWLESLNLQGNLMTSIPLLQWPTDSLDVSNNVITYLEFTHNLGNHTRYYPCDLPIFNFQNNNITHFKNLFEGWYLPFGGSEFDKCMEVLTRQISGNPFVCDCKESVFYRHLPKTKLLKFFCINRINDTYSTRIPINQFKCNVPDNCSADCSCFNVPSNNTLVVKCQKYRDIALPEHIPVLYDGTTLELNFKASNLRSLSFRPYLSKATKIILSSSSITDISMDTIKSISKDVEVLHLDNNEIKRLPDNILDAQFPSLVDVRLGGNPWDCACQVLILREFILKNYDLIKDVQNVKCHSPETVANRKVVDISRASVCQNHDTVNKRGLIGAIVTGSLVLVVGVLICMLKHKVKEGKKVRIPVANRHQAEDEQEDEGKVFDIFVSYATDDEEYAGEWLIPELERRGFKVCFHRVHFLGGVPIHVNMHQCIEKSKRMLAFFSKNFVASGYSMYEFDLALSLDIDAGTKKLVTIKDTALDINTLEPSYASYFRTHTYIRREEEHFWDNLLFTMPQNKLGEVEVEVAQFEVDDHAV